MKRRRTRHSAGSARYTARAAHPAARETPPLRGMDHHTDTSFRWFPFATRTAKAGGEVFEICLTPLTSELSTPRATSGGFSPADQPRTGSGPCAQSASRRPARRVRRRCAGALCCPAAAARTARGGRRGRLAGAAPSGAEVEERQEAGEPGAGRRLGPSGAAGVVSKDCPWVKR